MNAVPRFYDGSGQPLTTPTWLNAGPLRLLYEAGSLRYLTLGEHEVLRMMYAAVRDHNWNTVPGVLADVFMELHPESFLIRYTSRHRQQEVDFVWSGELHGSAEGVVTFSFSGEALSTFQRNRIGFCVLHPMTCAGRPLHVEQVDGTRLAGVFPQHIAPHQPFRDIRTLRHEIAPGQWAVLHLEGDTFEMEDQRNWIDASYKTYCTPLALPFPVTVPRGTRIEQRLTLRLEGAPAVVRGAGTAAPVTIHLDPAQARPLPALGLDTLSQTAPLAPAEVALLRGLHLAHVRVDVRLHQPGWRETLRRAQQDSAALGVPLELALHVSAAAESELAALAQALPALALPVARWLIFHTGAKSTPADTLHRARQALGPGAFLVGGTDAFFTELNRERPPLEALDGITYSLNPQVHAFDNASLTETLPVLAVTLASARAFSGDRPLFVSPVTFKMRWNPNATGPQPPADPGALPPAADVRQMSLFGAGWTAGSLPYLAAGGAAAVTFFSTVGYTGVIAGAAGSALPELFPAPAGTVYPLYHVLADAGEFAGGEALACTSDDGLRVQGLALRQGGRLRLLLANLTGQPQTVRLAGLAGVGVGVFRGRTLDETTVAAATTDPAGYRAAPGTPVEVAVAVAGTGKGAGMAPLTLRPFAVLTLTGDAE
jgi:hypothetical protein